MLVVFFFWGGVAPNTPPPDLGLQRKAVFQTQEASGKVSRTASNLAISRPAMAQATFTPPEMLWEANQHVDHR